MALKKQNFSDDEVPIFGNAVIYKRNEYWHFRMWLTKENKYARESLRTTNKSIAIDRAEKKYHELYVDQQNGKKYFSKTTKQGVEEYLAQRQLDVDAGLIVKGRLSTIRTHLEHWLDFIGRDTKLKELERTHCENYLHSRTKTNKNISVSQTTIANEQSTINALMSWLFKHNETTIDKFDFKPLKRIDRGDEDLRRSSFSDEEIIDIKTELEKYIAEAKKNIDEEENLTKVITGYYLLISIITGLRRGEQLQLKWSDVDMEERNVKGQAEDETYSLVWIRVRAETTKVRKTRRFVVEDREYFYELRKLLLSRYLEAIKTREIVKPFIDTLVFSTNGTSPLTARAISYHFDKILELADVKNIDKRNLVPYSFRHYFITDRINKGATPTQVAETCGTSTVQIEKTYYHTTEAKMISNALPKFYLKDGVLVPF